MKQLGILDSAFINLEQGNTPQNIGGLGIYDPSTAPDGFVRFKQVIANFEQRLQRLPLFRTRLVEVPGGIDRPYWVKDANFDVEFHLRHIALPQPGDWRQLCIQVARLHARPLDMARPLWECYIIEGLDNIPNLPPGSFAVYTKMHHSLVDGAGGTSFMAALHDLEPDPAPVAAEEQPLLVDRQPSTAELMSRATANQVKSTVGMLRGAVSLAGDTGRFALDLLRKRLPMPDIQAPRTRFNGPVGPYRIFEATQFSMAEFKRVKDATGVKLNDVALAVVGGGMARYLKAKSETPEESLVATLPVNLRDRRDAGGDNNVVGSIFASLHTDIEDPLERLKAIHVSTGDAKQVGEANPMIDTIKAAGLLAPALSKTAASIWSRRNLSQYLPFHVSTVITNVPGPNFDLYCAGARMVQYYGLGLLTPGVGLFHTVFTQAETVNLSVLGDRDIIPDPDFYIQCLREAWDELDKATASLSSKKSAGKPANQPDRKKATAKKATAKKAAKTAAKKATGKSPRKKAAGKKRPARKTQAKKKAAAKTAPQSASSPRAVESSAAPTRLRARRKSGAPAPKLKVVSG